MYIVNVEGAIYRKIDGRWLIVKRSAMETHAAGTLALVGGKVEEAGHSTDVLEQTLIREIDEEVGIRVNDRMHYVRSTSFVTDDGHRVVDVVFLCEYADGEPWKKSPDEVDEVRWMTCAEIMNHPNSPIWLRDNLAYAERVRQRLNMVDGPGGGR